MGEVTAGSRDTAASRVTVPPASTVAGVAVRVATGVGSVQLMVAWPLNSSAGRAVSVATVPAAIQLEPAPPPPTGLCRLPWLQPGHPSRRPLAGNLHRRWDRDPHHWQLPKWRSRPCRLGTPSCRRCFRQPRRRRRHRRWQSMTGCPSRRGGGREQQRCTATCAAVAEDVTGRIGAQGCEAAGAIWCLLGTGGAGRQRCWHRCRQSPPKG